MFVNDKKGGFSEYAMDPVLVASKQSHGVVTLDANMDGWPVRLLGHPVLYTHGCY